MKIPTEVRYGVWLGLALCIYTTFMWVIKFDSTYLSTGKYLDTAVILLPITFTFLAIWAKSKETQVTFFKRIRYGLTTNFFGYIIHLPFLLFYHHFLNPDWLKYVLEFKEKELLAQNASAEQIQTALDNVRMMSSDLNLITNGLIVGVIIFGIAFSSLTLPFIRRKTSEIS